MHGLFAKHEYCIDRCISCSVSYSHSRSAATSYGEVYVYLHYRLCWKYSPFALSKQRRVGSCHLDIQYTSSCMFSQCFVCSTDYIFKYFYKNKSHWVNVRRTRWTQSKIYNLFTLCSRFIWNSQRCTTAKILCKSTKFFFICWLLQKWLQYLPNIYHN